MIYLLDTVVINTYLKYINNFKYGAGCPTNINFKHLASFIEENLQKLMIPCSTLYELYTKCFLNPKNWSEEEPRSLDLSQFIDDYRFICENEILILNGMGMWKISSYFNIAEWENFLKTGSGLEAHTYIDGKIKYETEYILQYILMICYVCDEVLFDAYGETVNTRLHSFFYQQLVYFIEQKIHEFLEEIYYGKWSKKQLERNIDKLLYSILTQYEKIIKSRTLLSKNVDEVTKFISDMQNFFLHDIGEHSGADKANAIFLEHLKSSKKYRTSSELIGGVVNELNNFAAKKHVFYSMPEIEIKYLCHLIKKTCIDRYRVTKNDFTDCIILSSCDYIRRIRNDEVCLITFDERLKKFIKDDGQYYNPSLYDFLYQ